MRQTEAEQASVRWVFEAPDALGSLHRAQGLVALNGVSLTVNEVDGHALRREHHPLHFDRTPPGETGCPAIW